jgi:hypothetical protein
LKIKEKLVAVSAVAVAVTVASVLPAQPASAQDAKVTSIAIVGGTSSTQLTLSLTFDKGISASEADRLRSSLAASVSDVGIAGDWGDPLHCWGEIQVYDNNGSFGIAYNCGNPRTAPWHFQIASQVRAIIVGNVNEQGLSFWRNSFFAGQNAPHTVPSDYLFHGTITPALYWDSIDYQDYISFRHNLGGGGSGAIAFAGSVHLEN